MGQKRGPRVGLSPARRRTAGLAGAPLGRHAQQPVRSEGLSVEEHGRAHAEPGVEAALEHALPARDDHAKLGNQRTRNRAVRRRAVDRERAAVADQRTPADPELVAPRVAAEVVVIVEDEDARGWTGGLAKVPGGGQPADAGADDDQVVALAGVDRFTRHRPERPALQRVGDLERAVVAAAKTGQRRWVRGRAALHIVEAQSQRCERRQQRAAQGERDAIQEVAPRELAQFRYRAWCSRTAVSVCPDPGPRPTGRG